MFITVLYVTCCNLHGCKLECTTIVLCSLGDPDAISNVYGRDDLNYLKDWANSDNLQLLNLM